MPRYLVSLAVTVAALAPATSAAATFTVTVTSVGDENYNDANASTPRYVNAAQCADNVDVDLDFRGVPAAQVLDFWLGSSCDSAANRTGDRPNCTHLDLSVDTDIGSTDEISMSVPVDEILEGLSSSSPCDSGGEAHVYVLAAATLATTAEIGAGSWIDFTLDVDLTPPSNPADLSGGSGSTNVSVRWDAQDDTTIDHYEVHAFAVETCDETTAGSDGIGLEDGATPPTASDAFATATKGSSAADVDPSAAGLDYAEGSNMAEVAVVAVDDAGNRSDLSNVGCLERVETGGFCAEEARLGGECKNWSCAVRAIGANSRSPYAGALVGLAWASVLLSRGSRRKR